MLNWNKDRANAIEWARKLLASNPLFLDTETTGLDGYIVQISICNSNGVAVLNTLVNPLVPIEPAATAVHHITQDMVETAATFREVSAYLEKLLPGRTVAVYNLPFDYKVLTREWEREYTPTKAALYGAVWDDIMLPYAAFVGEPGKYSGYKWQKLPSGDHSALGDCRAALAIVNEMANTKIEE